METGNLWGAMEPTRWREVACISDRVATEEDVFAGRAVFYLGNLDDVPAWPDVVGVPALVVLRDAETGDEIPGVLIQAERSDLQCTAGVRFLRGGNCVCLLEELEFVDDDDPRLIN